MCFEMIQRVDCVEDPDVKQIFRVFDAGRVPDQKDLEAYIKTATKIRIDTDIVGKVVEIAKAQGNITQVAQATDIPTMFDRGVLFVDRTLQRILVDVAHHETTWASPDIRLADRAIMIQLQDFSYVAQVSVGEANPEDWPQYPPDDKELIRRELRIKFNLDGVHSWVYEMPKGWKEAMLHCTDLSI